MLHWLSRLLISLALGVTLLWTTTTPALAQSNPAELGQAVTAIEELDALRSGLASTLEGRTEPPTGETFKEVCKPVGMQAQKLSQEHGWQVKQIARKYRNLAHAPDSPLAFAALAKFAQDPDLMGFWASTAVDGQAGQCYFRRINVEASCLACHGAKRDRPQFVKAKYPGDLAFNFKAGDLRGMYSVFIPDLQAALQTGQPAS